MKLLNSCFGRKGISKKTISSPFDLFYNDPTRYKNNFPEELMTEAGYIAQLNPKIAEIKSLAGLKAYLNLNNEDSLENDWYIKFIITKQRTLLLGQFLYTRKTYVTHPAIVNHLGYNNSDEIVAAGRLLSVTNYRGMLEVVATNESGHYRPGTESVKHLDALIKCWGGYGARDESNR